MNAVHAVAESLKKVDPRFAVAERVEFSEDAKHTYAWRERGELVGFVTMRFIHFYFSSEVDLPYGSLNEPACSHLLKEGAHGPLVCYGWSDYGRYRDVLVGYQDRITI